jgi:hypothetical protein
MRPECKPRTSIVVAYKYLEVDLPSCEIGLGIGVGPIISEEGVKKFPTTWMQLDKAAGRCYNVEEEDDLVVKS